jgi:hypothetical protein
MLVNDLIARCGKENVAGFGRLLLKHIHERAQATEAAGVKNPTLILCDHEFLALVYFLSCEKMLVTMSAGGVFGPHRPDGELVQVTYDSPEVEANHAASRGFMTFAGCTVVSEGRAMAVIRDQAQAQAAAGRN